MFDVCSYSHIQNVCVYGHILCLRALLIALCRHLAEVMGTVKNQYSASASGIHELIPGLYELIQSVDEVLYVKP